MQGGRLEVARGIQSVRAAIAVRMRVEYDPAARLLGYACAAG
jgi:hypothetical protein